MIKQHFSVPFDLKSLVTDKLPTVNDLASEESLREIYGFQLENQHALPFYRLGKKSVEKAQMQAEGAYAMMIEGLTRLFETPELIRDYFDSHLIREHRVRLLNFPPVLCREDLSPRVGRGCVQSGCFILLLGVRGCIFPDDKGRSGAAVGERDSQMRETQRSKNI